MRKAQGRLDYGPPVGVIDIGSNSVRLVVYEGLTRSPTPLFNEKALAGLGREVQTTGLLAADAVDKALDALRRFRALCDRIGVPQLYVLATAACRDARNGKDLHCAGGAHLPHQGRRDLRPARGRAVRARRGLRLPSPRRHRRRSRRRLARTGRRPWHRVKTGITLPLGGLALQDVSAKSIKKAEKIVGRRSSGARLLSGGRGRTFYAIGGTWRSLARLHMGQNGYPLHVMHGYVIPAREA